MSGTDVIEQVLRRSVLREALVPVTDVFRVLLLLGHGPLEREVCV